MGKGRFLLALTVAALFLAWFLFRAGRADKPLLPALQAVPSILRWWGGAAALALGAMVAGRAYCSVLCPLGTFQEAVWRAGRRRLSGYAPGSPVRYWILALVLAAGAAGVAAVPALLDPYAAFGRGVTQLLRPSLAGGIDSLAGFLESLGLYGVISGTGRVPFVPGLFWSTAAFFLALTLWSLRKGRPFCDALCPVGTFLGLFSRSSLLSIRFSAESCTGCGLCGTVCPQECISVKERTVDADRCVLCLRCVDACPGGALSLSFGGGGQSLSRRGLLRTAAGTLAALGVAFWSSKKDDTIAAAASSRDEKLPVSPPGSKSRGNFTKKCVACTACVAACPAGIIRPSLGEWGAAGLFQPVLDYRRGYCQYGCTACGDACPTGAIESLEPEEKQLVSIGKARFMRRNCIVRKYGTACGACSEHCPTQAMRMVPFRGGLTIPELDPSICLGCGACEYACPAEPKAVTVSGLAVHGKIRPVSGGEGGPTVAPLEEFPF